MKFVIIIGIIIVISAMFFINYVMNKDEEEPPSLLMKLWLVPVLTLLLVSPFVLFGMFYWILIKFAGLFNPIVYADNVSLFGVGLLVIIALLLAEVFIFPIVGAVYFLVLKRKPYWVEKNIISILIDACIIYFVMDFVPSIEIKHWMTAFSISVVSHIVGWFIEGIALFYKRKRRKS